MSPGISDPGRIAGDVGWSLCLEKLGYKEPGGVFAAGVLALESKDIDKLKVVFTVFEQAPETARAMLSARLAIQGVGCTGDTEYIPWLVKQMEDPQHARVAGEAFTYITGVDIAYDDLEGEWPDGFEAGPSEDPGDDNVAMDEDEDLPWPDVNLITDWWRRNRQQFPSGQRCLLGKPVTPEHCQWVLVNGQQRQRGAAALEIALMQPQTALFETRMVGKLQQKILSAMPA